MAYLEELLPEFKKGIKIRRKPWREGRYIKLKGLYARDEYGNCYFLEPDEIAADDWEFYQEPIDWDYIIKNKCLCWFWDDEKEKRTGYLTSVGIYSPRFEMNGRSVWAHCRPVHKDEVTFYEDRNDD